MSVDSMWDIMLDWTWCLASVAVFCEQAILAWQTCQWTANMSVGSTQEILHLFVFCEQAMLVQPIDSRRDIPLAWLWLLASVRDWVQACIRYIACFLCHFCLHPKKLGL